MTEKITTEFRRFLYLPILIICLITNVQIITYVLPEFWGKDDSTDYSNEYFPIAQNIHNGFSYNECLDPCTNSDLNFASTRRAPIFPLIIAVTITLSNITGLNQLDILLSLQYLALLTSAIFVHKAIIIINPSRVIGATLATVLFANNPIALYYIKDPNPEIFLLLPVSILFYLTLRVSYGEVLKRKHIIIILILCAWSIFTKYTAILLPIGVLYLIIKHGDRKSIFVYLIGAFFCYSAFAKFYTFHLSERDAPKSSLATTVLTTGVYWKLRDGQSQNSIFYIHASDRLKEFLSPIVQKYDRKLESDTDSLIIFKGVATASLRDPLAFLELIFWKLVHPFFGTESGRFEIQLLLVNAVFFGAFMHMFIIMATPPTKKVLITVCITIGLPFYLIAFISVPHLRYFSTGFIFVFPLVAALFRGAQENSNEYSYSADQRTRGRKT